MAVAASDWLTLMQHEYLRRYVADRGCTVKFITGSDAVLRETEVKLAAISSERLLPLVRLDTASTKLHMLQDVFFAVAKETDWDQLAQRWIEAVFRQHNYEWPRPGDAVALPELADVYHIDQSLLRQQVLQWLTRHLMNQRELSQDFRSAMAHLCMRRLEPLDEATVPPVIEWLRGELRSIGAVRQVPINAKITRHNARAMLRSLFHWLRIVGGRGFVTIFDLRQLSRSTVSEGLRYTPSAVMDAFEVLRQIIDEAESFEGLFLFVMADQNFTGDDVKRSLSAYQALKERIYADVYSRAHENPLAPLLQLAADGEIGLKRIPGNRDHADMPYNLERVAVEALRAGVPNRAAIKLLGTNETGFCERFIERLRSVRFSTGTAQPVQGEIIAGGFGAGKSHLIGYLAEQALDEEFVVSKVAISKETPLFDPDRLFTAAIRNTVVARENADVMELALRRLKPDTAPFKALEERVSSPEARFSPIFAAILYLWPRQSLSPEDRLAIIRFLSGAKIGIAKIRQWLRTAGGAGLMRLFDIKSVKAAELADQRLRFAPALFRAAGFSGWCVLLDEVELIGRYSALQRGRSYAEMARWLSLSPESAISGVVSVCAIVSDYADVMMSPKRLDAERIPVLLREKGLDQLARPAELAIEAIETKQHVMASPTLDTVRNSFERVRELYKKSYAWAAPLDVTEQPLTGSATMRRHIKSWITRWDIQRLYGVTDDDLEIEIIKPDYEENAALERVSPGDAAEEEVL